LKHVKTILIKLLYSSGLQKLENENEEIKFNLSGNLNDELIFYTHTLDQNQI
jgi:hypothetical protein